MHPGQFAPGSGSAPGSGPGWIYVFPGRPGPLRSEAGAKFEAGAPESMSREQNSEVIFNNKMCRSELQLKKWPAARLCLDFWAISESAAPGSTPATILSQEKISMYAPSPGSSSRIHTEFIKVTTLVLLNIMNHYNKLLWHTCYRSMH